MTMTPYLDGFSFELKPSASGGIAFEMTMRSP